MNEKWNLRHEVGTDVIVGDAMLSPCGRYRYSLSRHFGPGPEATFIMLNPSTADALVDDPTIRKCIGFARRLEMGGLYVGNLFAVRATDPRGILSAGDPVGPENRDHLEWLCYRAAKNGGVVICAWGAQGVHMDQDETFLGWLDRLSIEPKALAINKNGTPKHPLYVPYGTDLVPYDGRGRRR
jgi:hypothetical protein